MKDFIDETSTQEGTPINRANLMAIQGFISNTITFNDDGSITETNSDGEILTTTLADEKITETFIGEKTIIKTTNLTGNSVITTITG